MNRHIYTEEERQFLKEFIPGHTRKEIQIEFNSRFGCNISVASVKSYMSRHNIRNGIVKRFQKGCVPANKGKNIPNPKIRRPVGSESVDSRGYTKIKIAEPDKWMNKQRYIWEKTYGPIPKGYLVIFRDNNNRNMDISNLMLVSKTESVIMNRYYSKYTGQLRDTALLLADLRIEISRRKKELKNEDHF